jgi:hypothetical protein
MAAQEDFNAQTKLPSSGYDCHFTVAPSQSSKHEHHDHNIVHVLLISIDGMHARDFLNSANGISTVNNGALTAPTIRRS